MKSVSVFITYQYFQHHGGISILNLMVFVCGVGVPSNKHIYGVRAVSRPLPTGAPVFAISNNKNPIDKIWPTQ